MTTTQPTKPASRDTIRRWMRTIMTDAGIDVKYRPHSTRGAAASKAKKFLTTEQIVKTIGWKNSSIFAKYYNKPIKSAKEFSEVISTCT